VATFLIPDDLLGRSPLSESPSVGTIVSFDVKGAHRLVRDEAAIDDSGEVSFQTSHGLSFGLACGSLPLQVDACPDIVAALRESDRVHCAVQLPITAPIEPSSFRLG